MAQPATDNDIGLKVLRKSPAEAAQAIDIVAIHGIGAHPDDTWCKNVGTAESPRWVNWLEEKDMLPAIAPNARIMRYGYQSQWFVEGAMRQKASTIAQRLLLALQRKRKEYPFRPLIFIAHCFGGLVVLKTLLDARRDTDEWPGIFDSTTGLVFFGTPFRGAEGTSQIEMLEAARREYHEDEVRINVLRIQEPGNEFLREVVEQFGKIRSQANKADIACFYELKSSNVGKVVGKQNRTRFVVSESSGCLEPSDGTSKFSLSRTHFDMNKFGKPTEEDFKTVRDVIKKMIGTSHELVLARSQYDSKNKIDLSHPGLPVVIYEGQHLDVTNPDVLPFRPIKHLGMGGSASVEMIQLKTNGWQFAHKIFRKVPGQRLDEAKRNFRNEIEIIKRLSPHPHIIRTFATYTCGRTLGMLLAPVADNGDLGTYLQMILDSENFPTTEQTTILEGSFGCLANGLAFIHKHTIRHKDIKPQNILIHKGRVIYTDFGIALDASQQENTTTVGNPGAFTRRYCAPEVANWEKRNRKSDVFSLGCVFLEILAVLEPQIGLGVFNLHPYWKNIDSIRDVLDHSSTSRPGRDQILHICYDMLEPNHEDRSSAAALLRQMDLLWHPWSDPVFECFCNECAPRRELETVGAEAALLTQQQRSEETVALSVSSRSISHPLRKDGAFAQQGLTLHSNCSMSPISGKLRGKNVYGTTGYRQSLPGSTFSPASDNVEFELEDILADEGDLNNEVTMGLIKNLKIPSPTANPPLTDKEVLFPAHLIFLATSEMWNNGFVKESERFLANIIQSIQQEVVQRDSDEAVPLGAFWLSNVHEMLSFILFFAEDRYEQQRTDSHEYDRLLEIVQHDLKSLEFSIYHTWMKILKRKLHKMIVPAIIESQSLPGFVTRSNRFLGELLQTNIAPAYSIDNLLDLLNNVHKAMKAFYLEDSIITMTLTEMLRLVGVTAFNDMLMRRNFFSWKRGLQIKYNITRIEEWCKSHDLPECMLQLEHLMQATELLLLKKSTLNDIEIIQDICWILSPNQIQKLLDQYILARHEQPINGDLMKAVASRVTEKSDTLLPAVDMVDSGPYEIAQPRVITALETYTPSWLRTPRLRRLAEVVSARAVG